VPDVRRFVLTAYVAKIGFSKLQTLKTGTMFM
jgi:hypothetical protein